MESNNTTTLHRTDLSVIGTALVDGKLQIRPAEWYRQFDENTIKYFMYVNAFYVLPTIELIHWLAENITGSAIEICAGNGAIGRALGIPITDSHSQADPKVIAQLQGQPPVTYLNDVLKFTAARAITFYQPDTVIGAFVTHKFEHGKTTDGNQYGVREQDILRKVKRYIMIGNLVTHQNKPILQVNNQAYMADWLITRSVQQRFNRIWVWEGAKNDNQ